MTPQLFKPSMAFPHQNEMLFASNTDGQQVIYPEQREDDPGETSVHNYLRIDLFSVLLVFLKKRDNVFVAANMNLYYEEGNPNKWFAPDILIAFGVPNHDRSTYQIWKENVSPQVIFEISSERTWKIDLSEKLEMYSRLGVEEYYILDPEFAHLPAPLLAFHRQGDRLLSAWAIGDRIHSPRMGLEIVRTANDFRLFDRSKNDFLRTLKESEGKLKRLRGKIARLREECEFYG